MKVAHLFLDECSYEPLDLAALTGVVVPADSYVAVRDAMCELAMHVSQKEPGQVSQPPEFHARDLLGGLQSLHGDQIDTVRHQVLQRVVDVVTEHSLRVFRVVYLNRSEIAQLMPDDPRLYGITFFGMLRALQPILEGTLVLPVMDGVPATGVAALARAPRIDAWLIRSFAHNIRTLHHYLRYPTLATALSIRNAQNIGEVTFADSTHSVMIQLVDLVSHLLLQIERAERETDRPASPYREQVIRIAKRIPPHLVSAWAGKMRIGQPPSGTT